LELNKKSALNQHLFVKNNKNITHKQQKIGIIAIQTKKISCKALPISILKFSFEFLLLTHSLLAFGECKSINRFKE